ncbi:hypothetical protein, partial [Fulvivirga aurantia]|uniref:hypothetical protein n=1 Tax=Fulvivirga aurantia TaxID=2529383 RepID=UPI00162758A1
PNEIIKAYTRQEAYYSLAVDGSRYFAKRLVGGPSSLFYIISGFDEYFVLVDEASEEILLTRSTYKSIIKEEMDKCISIKDI